jgi:CheY-like chemotaxis protein
VLADVLRGAGHEVAVAYDGPQALSVARAFQPNAALLDIGLPVLDGYELAEKLRELLPGRPLRLVAVTGYGQDTDKRKSSAAGFHAHLVKPIDLRALMALLDEECEGERPLAVPGTTRAGNGARVHSG